MIEINPDIIYISLLCCYEIEDYVSKDYKRNRYKLMINMIRDDINGLVINNKWLSLNNNIVEWIIICDQNNNTWL